MTTTQDGCMTALSGRERVKNTNNVTLCSLHLDFITLMTFDDGLTFNDLADMMRLCLVFRFCVSTS